MVKLPNSCLFMAPINSFRRGQVEIQLILLLRHGLGGLSRLGILFHFSFQSWIIPIFDVVVCTSRKEFGDFRPFISESLVQLNYWFIFFGSPLVLLYVGVQVVVPPFSALLSDSTRKCLGNLTPVLCSILSNIFREFLIFFNWPWSFNHWWIENLLPAMQTLHIGAILKKAGDSLPVFRAKLHNEVRELLVFFSVPVPFVIVLRCMAVHLHCRVKGTLLRLFHRCSWDPRYHSSVLAESIWLESESISVNVWSRVVFCTLKLITYRRPAFIVRILVDAIFFTLRDHVHIRLLITLK